MDTDERRNESVANAGEPSPPNDYAFPLRLGRYTLTKLIALGGMAEVFLAHQDGPAGFQKTVVVKRIHPHLARDKNFVQMFQREARVAAQLAHPNVVQIFELGEIEGQHFIVMEYIEGLSIQRLARRAWSMKRSIPLEVIAGILADAALGLQHAHSANVIHRDISPENLIISTEGVTKVLDFGLAKPQRGATLTGIGELKGKMPFMSPEHVRGDALDGRSDVYALGVCAYWLLTGRRPINAENDMHLLTLIMTEHPARPSTLNPAVPAPFDELVMAMLEKDREKRPASAREVHDALSEYAPMRLRLAAPFVAEMMAVSGAQVMVSDDEPPSGFVPSSPQTDRVLTRWRRFRDMGRATDPAIPLPESAPRRINPVVAASAAVIAVALAAITIVVMKDDGDVRPEVAAHTADTAPPAHVAQPMQPEQPAPSQPAPSQPAPSQPAPSQPAPSQPAPSQPTPSQPANAQPAQPAPPTQPTQPPQPTQTAQPTPPTQPAQPAQPAQTATSQQPAQPVAVMAKAAAAAQPDGETQPPDDDSKSEPLVADASGTEPAIASRKVSVRAPAHVQWLSTSGRLLGKGTATLDVTGSRIVAFDTRRRVKTTVAAKGAIDYGALPTGTLDIRVFPYAEVFAGKESLGTTPMGPKQVVIGTYTLTFVYEGKKQVRTLEVTPGQIARVKIDFQ